MKPNCDCTEEIIKQMKKDRGDIFEEIYFQDQNFLTGGLTNYLIIEAPDKNGKKRKMKKIYVAHSFCPFCGKEYIEGGLFSKNE